MLPRGSFKLRKYSHFVLLFLIFSWENLVAQPGTLDKNFGNEGITVIPFEGGYARVLSMAIQSDSKIVAAGFFHNGQNLDFALARFGTNGLLDASFGTYGLVTTDFYQGDNSIRSVVIQNDGKIVASGYAYQDTVPNFIIARYNYDGTLDSTFGNNGVSVTQIEMASYGFSSAIQSDGKIVVAGTAIYSSSNGQDRSSIALARYKPDGLLDSTFGVNGILITTIGEISDMAQSVKIQDDGKIVVAGSSIYKEGFNKRPEVIIIRYTANGEMDKTFGIDGVVVSLVNLFSSASEVILDSSKILVSGSTYDGITEKFLLLKFNEEGVRDSIFGTDGVVTKSIGDNKSIATSLVLQPDHKILEIGYTFNGIQNVFALARFNENGSIDSVFGEAGIVTTAIDSWDSYLNVAVMQKDGRIVVGGSAQSSSAAARFVIAQYSLTPNLGILNNYEAEPTISIFPNPVNDRTTLSYKLASKSMISICLYDLYGNKIFTFISNQVKNPGISYEELIFPTWISSGMYMIVLSASSEKKAIKILKVD